MSGRGNAGWMAEFVGFAATKDFRAARRAMRPQVGDAIITRRCGRLMTARVVRIDQGIVWERTREDMPEWPETCVECDPARWNAMIIRALRMGAEFRPVSD